MFCRSGGGRLKEKSGSGGEGRYLFGRENSPLPIPSLVKVEISGQSIPDVDHVPGV